MAHQEMPRPVGYSDCVLNYVCPISSSNVEAICQDKHAMTVVSDIKRLSVEGGDVRDEAAYWEWYLLRANVFRR